MNPVFPVLRLSPNTGYESGVNAVTTMQQQDDFPHIDTLQWLFLLQ